MWDVGMAFLDARTAVPGKGCGQIAPASGCLCHILLEPETVRLRFKTYTMASL